MKMKKKKSIRSMAAVTWLLVLAVGVTWLTSMGALTIVTAQEVYDALYENSREFTNVISRVGQLNEFYDSSYPRYGYQHERPEFLEYMTLSAIGYKRSASSYDPGSSYGLYNSQRRLLRSVSCSLDTAVLFYDGDGKLLHSSGDDVMFFDYYTQDEWDAGEDTTQGLHYGWIDISEGKNAENYEDDPYLRFRTMYAGTRSLYDFGILRIQGFFEGTRLTPVVMHYVTDTDVYRAVESTDQFVVYENGETYYQYELSDVDRTGLLDWQLQFDRSAEYAGRKLVTVYITNPKMWDYESEPLTYSGEKYESLTALTRALDIPSRGSVYPESDLRQLGSYTLTDLLVFSGQTYADYYGYYMRGEGPAEPELILVTAVRSNPLACAVAALRDIYIVTGLLALVLLYVLRSAVKKHLVQPVADIADAMADGWKNPYRPWNAPAMWREAEALSAGFSDEQDRRRWKNNEITRLNAALSYAKTAEENRRLMTSNIAHELKTPLAVIHSYAEGLKEHIAEDKREHYVDVILSEAERTDAMVLEMLDLSRLEAGKVKLARDDFSLVALTRAIFEKQEKAAEAKNLRIEFTFPEDFTVTADESRIAQVVENFATNAIKYTPEGGHISVTIEDTHGGAVFCIENDSPPLSDEALRRVWDTFYRADESRSGGGTGLGLAIAKNIIELHGGKCAVRNTKTGVEFRFEI